MLRALDIRLVLQDDLLKLSDAKNLRLKSEEKEFRNNSETEGLFERVTELARRKS